MDERSREVKNRALAANMRRLMAGRSIGALRQEMVDKGLTIGTGTIHRATLGEAGNRLESLEKIARFFEVTVDQLLMLDGVDETYWPFSEELQKKVILLTDEELYRAETVLRAHLGMPQIRASQLPRNAQFDTVQTAPAGHHASLEDGAGWPENTKQDELPGPTSDERSTQDRGRTQPKGRRSA